MGLAFSMRSAIPAAPRLPYEEVCQKPRFLDGWASPKIRRKPIKPSIWLRAVELPAVSAAWTASIQGEVEVAGRSDAWRKPERMLLG